MKDAGLLLDGALEIDLDERGGGDLAKEEAIGVDQEVMVRPRNAGRDVGVDHVVPAVQGDKPIERRQFDPRLPLRLAAIAPFNDAAVIAEPSAIVISPRVRTRPSRGRKRRASAAGVKGAARDPLRYSERK